MKKLFLLLCLLTASAAAMADDFLQKTSNYTAYVQGIDEIRFSLPTQMWSSFLNEGIVEGYVYVSVDDGPRQKLIEWNAGDNFRDIGDGISTECRIKGHIGGSFELVGKISGSPKTFKAEEDWTKYQVKRNDDNEDHYTTTVDWTVPRSLRGHKLVFEIWSKSEDRDYTYYMPSKSSYYKVYEWECPSAPEVSVQLSEPTLAYDPDHVNSIMFTYSFTARKVNWAKLHYTDALTKETKTINVNSTDLVGMLYLPADRPYSKILVEAQVVDSEGKTVTQPVESNAVSAYMLHNPVNLTFTPTLDGNMLLKWNVEHADLNDIVEGDFFEIQRNLTGTDDPSDANWQTISASIEFEKDSTSYKFLDESLMTMYKGKRVSYRVRRMYTSMWQWAVGAGHVQAQLPWTFVLPYAENATVHRTSTWNDNQHVVEVAFGQKSTQYDSEGNFIVRDKADFEQWQKLKADGKINIENTIFMVGNNEAWSRVCGVSGFRKIVLTSDLTLTNDDPKLGETDIFEGSLDGNGHTLTLQYTSSLSKVNYLAPITDTKGCGVKNLKVSGRVHSQGKFASALCGRVRESGSVVIQNVDIDAEISLGINGDASSGGFIGIMERSSAVIISNSAFHGTISGANSNNNGGFVGVAVQNTSILFHNCLFAPAALTTSTENCRTFVRADQTATVYLTSCFFSKKYGTNNANEENANNYDNQTLAEKLGKTEWNATNNGVYPVLHPSDTDYFQFAIWDKRAKMQLRINMHGESGVESRIVDLSANDDALYQHQFTQELSRKCVEYSFDLLFIRDASPMKIASYDKDTLIVPVVKTDQGELANYRFLNSNKITELTATTKQSSVVLNWKTSGGDHDFFRVMRKEVGSGYEWKEIATDLEQLFYEDKTVYVQHDYEYRVESVWQCEGTNIESATCKGWCEKTGMINGYVRMADGTAIAGQVVECRPEGEILGASALYTTTTDETGYYEFKGLPYQTNGTYSITVPAPGDGGSYKGPNALGTVNFTERSNWTQNFNYYMDQYFVYSGNVYYRNTSIPVPGVSFLLDGKRMHDASQKEITTNTQGAFSLSIPAGGHTVQAVKDGHFFAAEGFLINEDAAPGKERQYTFDKNISGATIWDSTTVVLRGRVVGGDIQGSKPLGENLSTNNLGDSIKIVMQLEGDNASYLILDPKDETVRSASYDVDFGPNKMNTTHVDVTRHTLTIHPDAKTGEYQLDLPPAKYKVVEVSAQGYATLFQAGKVGETIDLAFKVKGDTCEYNRIYHAVPDLQVTQFNPGNEPYYGVKMTTATDVIGNKADVMLWGYKHLTEKDSVAMYSFGYPVFMAGSPYGWMLQACEKYYWNNNINKDVDVVKLNGGKVTIKNYMVDSDDAKLTKDIDLDDSGFGSYVFTPGNANFNLADEMALRTVDITLEFDGSYYDVKPLNGNVMKGYVMQTQAKKGGTTTVAAGKPVLIDILRDPPGGSSSSYIEAGSKLSYSYSPSFEGSLGTAISVKNGTYSTIYKGAVLISTGTGAGTEAGTISEAHSDKTFAFTLASTFNGSWTTSYNFDVTERIQTRSGQKWIGGKADLFMGTNENIVMQDAIAVRAIPEDQYLLMKSNEGGSFKMNDKDGNEVTIKVPIGTMRLITQGEDAEGKPVYLVRDEVMSLGAKVKSTFIHSQNYIENELLPTLIKLRNDLIQVKSVDGQALADDKKEVVYVSTVDVGDIWFGADDRVKMYIPASWTDSQKQHAVNQVAAYNQEMGYWIDMLAQNEEEKINLSPTNLVKNYDIDGGASSLQYSETFTASRNRSGFVRWPGVDNASIAKLFPSWALAAINSMVTKGYNSQIGTQVSQDGNMSQYLSVGTATSGIKIKFDPIAAFNFNDKSGKNESQSKKIGFTIGLASKSSLNVDVYRTVNGRYGIKSNTPDPFLKLTTEYLKELEYGQPYHPSDTIDVYSSFVFRTKGGVTCQPYEGERVTKWYQPGTVIDVATIPADKPRIWVEEPVVSNVPFDEPARFVLHFANETDYPDRATFPFTYFLDAGSNPNGATVCVDGKALSSGGETIVMAPVLDSQGNHNVFTKELTIYPSKAFDYEDIAICLKDPEDMSRVFTQKVSAHFVPTGGKIKVTVPSNNWVINTESPYDGQRKAHYMPVRIEGFDINWPNFDHIELQYKLSNQGDKDWVSVCSYYADPELRSKASGVTDTIPNSGVIVAPFYGEIDPIEQYYDIRAVTYCRYAGGYLTGSSEVLSGIKDTRQPIVFGTPEPTNGILGIGDDIKIRFSEPIAGNYLRNINNFEVLGTFNNYNLTTSTSLSFTDEMVLVTTLSKRNLSGKSFTVDVMLNPKASNHTMTVFEFGGEDRGVSFGVTPDHKLCATINGITVESDKEVGFNNTLRQVAYALDQSGDDMRVNFFDGSTSLGSKTIEGKFTPDPSCLRLGTDYTFESNQMYHGEMLEFRLWNTAMKPNQLENYKNRSLTGYEPGLLNYYPMNEGTGSWLYDKAATKMDMMLIGTDWRRPTGLSIGLNGTKGLLLDHNLFERGKEHDYTLMFWFRAEQDNDVTLFSNGDAEKDKENQLNIGLENGQIFVKSDGFKKQTNLYATGVWHHFAMTVSRSQNVANIYFDKKLVDSFAADSIAGISSDHIALGATYTDLNTPTKVLKGNVDEIGMFSSVLPVNLIKEYATHTPNGTMSAMMAYLDFGRSEKQDNGTQRLMPTGISLKRYIDNQGNILARRDTLVAVTEVEALADRNQYAPMVSSSLLDNLNYNFAAHENELLIDITEPNFSIEKTNVYVTVKDVPDLQGNLMASPLTMNLFVYRNPLRWDVKKIETETAYGQRRTVIATIKNVSGMAQSFELTDMPVWLSASQTQGTLGALDEQQIVFTISEYTNVGTYVEQITLVGDNNYTETLPITLHVYGNEPEWAVDERLKLINQTMMMVAQVKVNGVIATDQNDLLAVFDDKQQVLGVANIEMNNNGQAYEIMAYLTIYGYTNDDGSMPKLNFRFYEAQSGNVYNLSPDNNATYYFKADTIIGTTSEPVLLVNHLTDVQTLHLKKGWNWVSFLVAPGEYENATVGQYFNSMSKWEAGDQVKSVDGTNVQKFTARQDKSSPTGYRWDKEDELLNINPALMFNVYSMSDKTIYLSGDYMLSGITVHKNWNRIAYTSTINLPIAQAMSDYMVHAQPGDVLKSQDGFAIVTQTATDLVWKGSLKYLEVGKGYMLKRLGDGVVSFYYPHYFDSRYEGNKPASAPARIAKSVNTASTMNIVATVEGVETLAGDLLVVYRGAERIAEAAADDEQLYWLNIGEENKDGDFTFAIEREGTIVATTPSRIGYEDNKVMGTPDEPTAINFVSLDDMPLDGRYYTLDGRLLGKKPAHSGVYILNGKAVFVK